MSLQLLTILSPPTPMHPCPTLTVLAAGQVAELPRSLSGSASVLGFTSLPRVFANASGRIEFIIFLIMDWSFASGCSPPRLSTTQLPSATDSQCSVRWGLPPHRWCALSGARGLRSLAAVVRRDPHRFTAPTERAPSKGSASNGPSVSLETWRAAVPRSRGSPISTPLHGADGADALQGIGRQWPMRFGAELEGCGPTPPRFADIHTASRRRRSGRPPGNRPAMAHPFRCRAGGLRSHAAAVRRYPHRFTAPTERAPSCA